MKKILGSMFITVICLLGISVFVINILFTTGVLHLGDGEDVVVSNNTIESSLVTKTEGLMILVESEGPDGITNLVNEMSERNIPGLLLVDANFVKENCSTIKTIMKEDIEIGGIYSTKPFWDMPYEDQYQVITGAKGKIENCTGKSLNIFTSKYYAFDENTLKAADALSIDIVMALGTQGAKSIIYKPEEYNVKIFSVSNMTSDKWGSGSLSDYSYWAHGSSSSEFATELRIALEEPKISPVSHTYIGGSKKAWNDVYLEFFDSSEIEWVSLDEFLSVDVELPYKELPENRDNQDENPNPLKPLEEEEELLLIEDKEADMDQ